MAIKKKKIFPNQQKCDFSQRTHAPYMMTKKLGHQIVSISFQLYDVGWYRKFSFIEKVENVKSSRLEKNFEGKKYIFIKETF